MKRLANNQQVAHYFANAVCDAGRGSNFYFETDRNGERLLFSYGRHFCIARRLDVQTFAFTTRRHSNSTAKHLAYARSALTHRTLVYCDDPSCGPAHNKREAQAAIDAELSAAETTRRIRPETRTAHKARALYLAEQFNTYLAALPESERADVLPFDVSGLDEMRAAMLAEEERKKRAEEERKRAAMLAEAEYVAAWRNDPSMYTQGMLNHPIALRLGYREQYKGEAGYQFIETSRGAEIPASDARMLWPVIVSVRKGERTSEEAARLVRRLGVYTLTTIRADGSIVVGCHDIAWSEIERMSVVLGLADEVKA
jgi:hypothetical protein